MKWKQENEVLLKKQSYLSRLAPKYMMSTKASRQKKSVDIQGEGAFRQNLRSNERAPTMLKSPTVPRMLKSPTAVSSNFFSFKPVEVQQLYRARSRQELPFETQRTQQQSPDREREQLDFAYRSLERGINQRIAKKAPVYRSKQADVLKESILDGIKWKQEAIIGAQSLKPLGLADLNKRPVFDGKYHLIATLGKGQSSKTYLAQDI
jgi:hypothetical protein